MLALSEIPWIQLIVMVRVCFNVCLFFAPMLMYQRFHGVLVLFKLLLKSCVFSPCLVWLIPPLAFLLLDLFSALSLCFQSAWRRQGLSLQWISTWQRKSLLLNFHWLEPLLTLKLFKKHKGLRHMVWAEKREMSEIEKRSGRREGSGREAGDKQDKGLCFGESISRRLSENRNSVDIHSISLFSKKESNTSSGNKYVFH